MSKYSIVFSIFVILFLNGTAQNSNYSINEIPDSISQSAEAVIRNYTYEFNINSKSKATDNIKYAITIFKRKALNHSRINLSYSDLSKIKKLKGAIYDKDGNMVKSFNMSDVSDYSYITSSSLFSDARRKFYDPEYENFPFTIEVSYTRKRNGILSYPSWYPHMGFDIGVQSASFIINVPTGFEIRYTEQNLNTEFQTNVNQYKWTVANRKPFHWESYSKSSEIILPAVHSAPKEFSVQGWDGNMTSWGSFGKWNNQLLQSAQDLSEDQKQEFISMVNSKRTTKEKIKTLYQYLQNNTRYLNISMGIGGWKPLDASFTHTQGMGDCKALTNYMYAMLDAVGIPAIYTAVNAGSNASEINKDFPSNQFNHVILCVPDQTDTIWLECTSQFDPMNHHSTFTDDRYVLLNKPEGGELVKTPSYRKEDNRINTKSYFKMNELGKGEVSITNVYSGIKYKSWLITSTDEEAKKEHVYDVVTLPDFKLKSFSHRAVENASIPSLEEKISVDVNNYGAKMGNLLFVPVNLLSQISQIPQEIKSRKNDVFVKRSYIYTDTITYEIPSGFKVKHLPEEENISCEIATYHCATREQEGKIVYVRRYEKNKGTYPPKTYENVRQFFSKVSKADAQKMVLEKIN
jgi:hypothetical protein